MLRYSEPKPVSQTSLAPDFPTPKATPPPSLGKGFPLLENAALHILLDFDQPSPSVSCQISVELHTFFRKLRLLGLRLVYICLFADDFCTVARASAASPSADTNIDSNRAMPSKPNCTGSTYCADRFTTKSVVVHAADGAKLYRTLYYRMVQGIVITGSVDARKFGESFDWDAFSVVQCARFHSPQPFHTVRPNIFQVVKLAFTELRKRGYRRIGFAPAEMRSQWRKMRPVTDPQFRWRLLTCLSAIGCPFTMVLSERLFPSWLG